MNKVCGAAKRVQPFHQIYRHFLTTDGSTNGSCRKPVKLFGTQLSRGMRSFSHVDTQDGSPQMVDVTLKIPTKRIATAEGKVFISQYLYEMLLDESGSTGHSAVASLVTNGAITSEGGTETQNDQLSIEDKSPGNTIGECTRIPPPPIAHTTDTTPVTASLKCLPKGNLKAIITTAELAGTMAAKSTHNLIPLCHPLPLTCVKVHCKVVGGDPATVKLAEQLGSISHEAVIAQPHILITSLVAVTGNTGVEMEALIAVSIAALTIYDMCKAIDRCMVVGDIKLISKTGGKLGNNVATR